MFDCRAYFVYSSILFLIVLYISSVVGLYEVNGNSMSPTVPDSSLIFGIENNITSQLVIPSRLDTYRCRPVVLNSEDHGFLLKNVLGLPGDTIEMESGTILVNRESIHSVSIEDNTSDVQYVSPPEPWHRKYLSPSVDRGEYVAYSFDWGPIIVPPSKMFVLGTNLSHSLDSRIEGFISVSYISSWPLFSFSYSSGFSKITRNCNFKI